MPISKSLLMDVKDTLLEERIDSFCLCAIDELKEEFLFIEKSMF